MSAPPTPPVALDSAAHREAQLLLPWFATATLPADEARRVEAHLAACPRCRAELQWERSLIDAQRALAPADDVERGLGALKLQIAAQAALRNVSPAALLPRLRQGWRDAALWLRCAFALQGVAVLALAGIAFAPPRDAYRALGSGASAAANLVIRFQPDAPAGEITRALGASGARIVGGPTASEVYLAAVPADRLAAALVRLRAEPSVALAESLAAAEPSP